VATTYEATDSTSGPGDFHGSAKHVRVMVNTTHSDQDTASTEAYTFANEETGSWLYGFAKEQAWTNTEPGTDGSNTGTFTMRLEITTGDTNVRFDDVLLHRVNSSDVSQASVSTGTSMPISMAAGTHTVTWSSPALGTWASTDYGGVEVQYTNTSKHGGSESVTFQFGDTANTTDISCVWTIDHTPPGPAAGLRTLGLTGAGV
jgi:hypothetical protein